MTTLVGHGYIGNAIAKRLGENRRLAHLLWYSHGKREMILNSCIVNAAGYVGTPNVDACETHKQECIEGNILWPMELERRYNPVPIIHITSGCVYNGYKDGGWTEEDEPNFTGSFYSLTKATFQKHCDLEYNYLLRIRMPFGAEDNPRNLLTKLRSYSSLVDSVNSLTNIDDLVKVVDYFSEHLPEPGIYNVCNPGEISTREIAEILGLNKEWISVTDFLKKVSAPRSFTTLNTDKIQKILPIRDVREALLSCV
jgi:dTDP-4-dehydrorhamnose reductase